MTELEEANDYIKILEKNWEWAQDKLAERFDKQLHDFRCAALSGRCSVWERIDAIIADIESGAIERIAQAMLKIARGDKS